MDETTQKDPVSASLALRSRLLRTSEVRINPFSSGALSSGNTTSHSLPLGWHCGSLSVPALLLLSLPVPATPAYSELPGLLTDWFGSLTKGLPPRFFQLQFYEIFGHF